MKPTIIVMTGELWADGRMVSTYHWLRITSHNGEIQFDSEDYSSKSNAIRAARKFSKLTGFPWKIT